MPRNAVLREVELTLPMVPDMEIAASETAAAMARYLGLSQDKIDEVRLAVVEVCINAFEHSRAPDRKVRMTCAILGEARDDPRELRIAIRDRGVGFDPDSLPTPQIEEKLKASRKRGWGMQIVYGLMDDVQVFSGNEGTEIVMSKLRAESES
ncbi:MAG: ATP-binding protein [Thermoanaerobaculia bacterium]